MRVYLAAAFERQQELRAYREALSARGIEVTSRWLDIEGSSQVDGTAECEEDARAVHAQEDLDDVAAADALISFTGTSGRGGRHVEFGFAVATGKRIMLVGQRENIFHFLPQVEWFEDWPDLLYYLESVS